MPEAKKYQIHAGQFREKKAKSMGLKRQAVLTFLRANPLSTLEEIYKGTGCGIGNAEGFVKRVNYGGKICYRVDELKIKNLK